MDAGKIEIIVRETYQAPENVRKSSFPLSRSARRDEFRPYAKDSLLAAREIDAEQAVDEEEEATADPTQELEQMGMSTFQAEPDEEEPEDDSDEDTRPEDEY